MQLYKSKQMGDITFPSKIWRDDEFGSDAVYMID